MSNSYNIDNEEDVYEVDIWSFDYFNPWEEPVFTYEMQLALFF